MCVHVCDSTSRERERGFFSILTIGWMMQLLDVFLSVMTGIYWNSANKWEIFCENYFSEELCSPVPSPPPLQRHAVRPVALCLPVCHPCLCHCHLCKQAGMRLLYPMVPNPSWHAYPAVLPLLAHQRAWIPTPTKCFALAPLKRVPGPAVWEHLAACLPFPAGCPMQQVLNLEVLKNKAGGSIPTSQS